MQHYKKQIQRDNQKKILDLLDRSDDLRFTKLKEKSGFSAPTLSSLLKILEEDDKIQRFHVKGEDRRIKRYRIKPESKLKVEAQLGTYEAIRFIEGISDPVYIYKPPLKNGKVAIAAFSSSVGKTRETTAKGLDLGISTLAHYYQKLKVGSLISDKDKLAIVIMIGGEKAE